MGKMKNQPKTAKSGESGMDSTPLITAQVPAEPTSKQPSDMRASVPIVTT
jgi:hypothetical protein